MSVIRAAIKPYAQPFSLTRTNTTLEMDTTPGSCLWFTRRALHTSKNKRLRQLERDSHAYKALRCPPCSAMGAAPPQQSSSRGAPVTESSDLSSSEVPGRQWLMFYKLPKGRAPTLCPYFLPAVCIVRGIIFPSSTMNSGRDDSHLANPITPKTYKSREGGGELLWPIGFV